MKFANVLLLAVLLFTCIITVLSDTTCRPCKEQYDPQCAIDEVTKEKKDFRNHCLIGQYNCQNKKNFKFNNKGPCPK